MIRSPLNVIPAWIVQVLQTGVALNRISVYLDEDEVDEQVSTLKRTRARSETTSTADEGLGIKTASFKWNEVEEKKDEGADAKGKKGKGKATNGHQASSTDASDATATGSEIDVDRESIASSVTDHRFELKDIDVVFPEGELTVVTGPTASGKTALLVRLFRLRRLCSARWD